MSAVRKVSLTIALQEPTWFVCWLALLHHEEDVPGDAFKGVADAAAELCKVADAEWEQVMGLLERVDRSRHADAHARSREKCLAKRVSTDGNPELASVEVHHLGRLVADEDDDAACALWELTWLLQHSQLLTARGIRLGGAHGSLDELLDVLEAYADESGVVLDRSRRVDVDFGADEEDDDGGARGDDAGGEEDDEDDEDEGRNGYDRRRAAAQEPRHARRGSRTERRRNTRRGGSFGGLHEDVGWERADSPVQSHLTQNERFFLTCAEVSWPFDANTLKEAWRRLVREEHPDRHQGDPDATARFSRLNDGYEALRRRLGA